MILESLKNRLKLWLQNAEESTGKDEGEQLPRVKMKTRKYK